MRRVNRNVARKEQTRSRPAPEPRPGLALDVLAQPEEPQDEEDDDDCADDVDDAVHETIFRVVGGSNRSRYPSRPGSSVRQRAVSPKVLKAVSR